MLASTIQFTTNTPTPNKQPHKKAINPSWWGQVRSAAPEPRQHAKPLKNPVPLCQKRQGQKSLNESLTVFLAVPKQKLLRKEVIQPHLPVRLPCYDFVPIANPTFDHSPRKNG